MRTFIATAFGVALATSVGGQRVPSCECHEGSYGLRNILSAARAEERQRAR